MDRAWALLLGSLVWIAPLITFMASNIQWFTRIQMAGAVCFSLVIGLLCGAGFGQINPDMAAVLAALIFCALSERLIDLFFPKIWGKLTFSLTSAAFSYCLVHFLGLRALCALLTIYCLFSLWDLWKNRERPKRSVQLVPRPGEKSIVTDEASPPAQLERKANIYILFLESIHSDKALRLLYGHDDAGLSSFLEERGFRVCSRACSNEYGTTLSLNTLLNMASDQSEPLPDAPLAFQWLHANSYRINLLDCAVYTFGHYVPYSDYFNFVIPGWVSFLYKWMMPFFLQSQLLNAITRGVDPFADHSNYAKVRADLQALQPARADHPCCQIIRFGATHVPGHYSFHEREAWIPKYLSIYEKSVDNIRDMIDLIIASDPEACIVAMGDHGAASWQGAWLGRHGCNSNMRENGVEPETVALDLTGTLLAIRLPGSDIPDMPMTPANIFRLIFQEFGTTEGRLPKRTPNNSYLHEPSNPYPFLIVRDGVALQDWLVMTPQQSLAEKLGDGNVLAVSSEHELLEITSALENSGNWQQAIDVLVGAMKHDMGSLPVVRRLAGIYLRLGRVKEALALMEPLLDANPGLVLQVSSAFAMLGSIRQAVNLLNAMGQRTNFTSLELQQHTAYLYILNCQPELADKIYARILETESHLATQISSCRSRAYCLDALGKTAAAIDVLDALSLRSGHKLKYMGDVFTHAAGLCLRAGMYEDMPERVRRFFEHNREPYPVTFFLWQAGYLEQANQKAEALAVLEKAYNARPPVPYLDAQLGLFLIRNKINDAKLRAFKKAGYEYLRGQSALLAAIFDESWFSARYKDALKASGMSPMMHFLHYGRLLGLDPCSQFNSIYYCLNNRDLFFAGYDPYWHFAICSPYEDRNPSLNFNLQSYMARHPRTDWATANPLIEYLHGQLK